MTTESRGFDGRKCWNEVGTLGDFSCPELARFSHCRNCPVFFRAGRSVFDREIPDQLRDEWTALLAREKATVETDVVSVVVFRVGPEYMGLKTCVLEQTSRPKPVHSVPFRSGGVFRGIVNMDGALLPCFSALDLFEISKDDSAPGDESMFLVVSSSRMPLVLDVNALCGIARLPTSGLRQPPSTVTGMPGAFSEGIFDWAGNRAALLNEQKLESALLGSMQSDR